MENRLLGVAFLLIASMAAAQPTGRVWSAQGACPMPVYWFSEGTAWTTPTTWAWLTIYNPRATPNLVEVAVVPDGRAPVAEVIQLGPQHRWAIEVGTWARQRAGGLPANLNFATTVRCFHVCGVGLATWNADYTRVVYGVPQMGCEADEWVSPYSR